VQDAKERRIQPVRFAQAAQKANSSVNVILLQVILHAKTISHPKADLSMFIPKKEKA
jgi:hypothetical protein